MVATHRVIINNFEPNHGLLAADREAPLPIPNRIIGVHFNRSALRLSANVDLDKGVRFTKEIAIWQASSSVNFHTDIAS